VTVGEALDAATDYLAAHGVERPRLDAELLLARSLGLTRLDLYTQHDRPLTVAERAAAREPVRRRGTREPLAYVLGDWGFRRLTLRTDRRALVPRPETESVVDRCLALLDGSVQPRVIDVGTGTGAIALALADELPGARVVATDASADALALARENAELLDLAVELREGDLLAGAAGPFDLVVSNPPYVAERDAASLAPELAHEPRVALFAGVDGTDVLRAFAAQVRDVLAPNGAALVELDPAQADTVAAWFAAADLSDVQTHRDMAGRARVVAARRRE